MKRSFLSAGVTLALCVPLAACDRDHGPAHEGNGAAAHADPADEAEAVKKVEEEVLAAFKAKDAAKVASYYAEDAVVSTPGRAAAKGREAIGKALQEDLSDPAFAIDFTNEKAAVSGDMGYTRGTFRVTFTNPQTKAPQNIVGNYVTVFRKQADGSWKATEDVASEGAAPAAGG
jgi:uncharacterized protein (TIGR02246 family)